MINDSTADGCTQARAALDTLSVAAPPEIARLADADGTRVPPPTSEGQGAGDTGAQGVT